MGVGVGGHVGDAAAGGGPGQAVLVGAGGRTGCCSRRRRLRCCRSRPSRPGRRRRGWCPGGCRPAPSTSGSEAGRLTPADAPPWAGTAPPSPEGAENGDVPVAGLFQCRVHRGYLAAGEGVLGAAPAGREHRGVQGGGFRGRLGHRGGGVRGAGLGAGGDQDDVEGGAGRERVHHLGVAEFIVVSQVGRRGSGRWPITTVRLARERPNLVSKAARSLRMSAGAEVRRGLGQCEHGHGLAAAVDSLAEQRRDAVGRLVGLRAVAGLRRQPGRRAVRRPGVAADAAVPPRAAGGYAAARLAARETAASHPQRSRRPGGRAGRGRRRRILCMGTSFLQRIDRCRDVCRGSPVCPPPNVAGVRPGCLRPWVPPGSSAGLNPGRLTSDAHDLARRYVRGMQAVRRLAGGDLSMIADAGLGIAAAGLTAVGAWGPPRPDRHSRSPGPGGCGRCCHCSWARRWCCAAGRRW